MADRTLSVKLLADIQGYVQGMDKVAAKTRETTASIESKLAEQKRAYEQVGAAALTVGALAAAGVTAAVVAFANFDQAMSNVQAATHESAENMALLRDAALEAGARTVYSATEAAAAIEELSKAGISTADILGGALDGALDLAAAGGIGVAEAAETAASAMTQFGIAGDEAVHIADLLAAGAGKAQGGVSDMGQALNQAGLVSAQMGLSIEETVGSLTAFASAGLIGSDAGTSFRAMLLRLANPTKESAGLMEELGLAFYDAQGDFIGVEAMAGQLQERLADLTQEQRNQALAQIFGQDAIRTSAILYEQGAAGVAQWTSAVDDSGYAAETAATRLDNLKGDFEQLTGALETAMIGIGEGGDGPLRLIVTSLADMVTIFTEMPTPVQQSVGVLGGLTAAVGLVGGGAMVAVPQVVAFRTALQTLGVSAGVTTTALSALGVAGVAGLAIGGLFALGTAFESTRPQASEFTDAILEGANAIDLLRLANEGFANTVDGFEFNVGNAGALLEQNTRLSENFFASFDPANWEAYFSDFNSRVEQVGEGLGDLAQSDLDAAIQAFLHFGETLGYNDEQMAVLLESMPELRDAWAAASSEAGESVSILGLVRDAQEGVGVTAEDAAESVDGVADSYEDAAAAAAELYDQAKTLNDLFFDSQDSMRGYEQSVDDIAEALTGEDALVPALTESRDAFNLDAQAGRDASAMLDGLVGSAQEASEGMSALGSTSEEVAAYQDRAREQIYNTGIQMGLSETAARQYADRLVAIPDQVATSVSLDTSGAQRVLSAFLNQRRVVNIEVAAGPMPSLAYQRGVVQGYAGGGVIPGYSPGVDDRLGFARDGNVYGLAGGEHIMPVDKTVRYLRELEAMRAGVFPQMGYASGGRIGYAQQPPIVNVQAPSGGGGPVVNVAVQPTPGMSEVAVGNAAAAAMAWVLR